MGGVNMKTVLMTFFVIIAFVLAIWFDPVTAGVVSAGIIPVVLFSPFIYWGIGVISKSVNRKAISIFLSVVIMIIVNIAYGFNKNHVVNINDLKAIEFSISGVIVYLTPYLSRRR